MKKSTKSKNKVKGFQVLENECVWMKAGIINYHICDMVYNCLECKFDKGMTAVMKKKGKNSDKKTWTDFLKEKYDGASTPCRHVITGRIQAPKLCTHNYECYNCAFDQMLDDIELSESGKNPEYCSASGYNVAKEYYYHKGHTWVRIEHGGRARVGFDDFIMRLFGKARFTQDLLNIGNRMKKGKATWSIAQDDNEASVLAPVSGTVLSVNQRVKENPEILHKDPYRDGWIFIVEPDSLKKGFNDLYYGGKSIDWIEKENNKLLQMLGPEYANLAATGGEPVRDFYGNNPDIGWKKLAKTFLKTKK